MNKLAKIMLLFALVSAAFFIFLAIVHKNNTKKIDEVVTEEIAEEITEEKAETVIEEADISNLKRTEEHVNIDIDPETYMWGNSQQIIYFDGEIKTFYNPDYDDKEDVVKDVSVKIDSIDEPIKISDTRWGPKLNEFVKFCKECIQIAESYEEYGVDGLIGYADEEEPEEEYDGHRWKNGEYIIYSEGSSLYKFYLKGKTTVYFEKLNSDASNVIWSYPLSYEMKTHIEDFSALNRVLDSIINGEYEN